jgi:hypothetical protein
VTASRCADESPFSVHRDAGCGRHRGWLRWRELLPPHRLGKTRRPLRDIGLTSHISDTSSQRPRPDTAVESEADTTIHDRLRSPALAAYAAAPGSGPRPSTGKEARLAGSPPFMPATLPPASGWAWRSPAGSTSRDGRASHRFTGSSSSTSTRCCEPGPRVCAAVVLRVPEQRPRRLLLPWPQLLSFL